MQKPLALFTIYLPYLPVNTNCWQKAFQSARGTTRVPPANRCTSEVQAVCQ